MLSFLFKLLIFSFLAPIAQLVGATSSDEGTKLNFSCNYTDVYPPGNKTIFSFGDEKTVLEKVNSCYGKIPFTF